MRAALVTAIIVIASAYNGRAAGPGTVAAEVGCGFGGGAALALAAVPVGNLFATDEFPGTGLYGLFLGYPAGVGLGVYAAGEIWGDDAANEWASAGAAVGASYAAVAAGYIVGKYKGLLIGMLVAPAASTAAYNLVKRAENETSADGVYFAAAFYF